MKKMENEITSAILGLDVIEFTYNGKHRVCEPHILGTANRHKQVLCYQTDGESLRGGIPQWRRFDLAGISDYRVTGQKFDGPRPIPSGPHSIWDSISLIVS